MLTPDDESYKMKAHRVLLGAFLCITFSFFAGFQVGRLFLRHNKVDIFVAIGMELAAMIYGWFAHRDFGKLVCYIPTA